MTDLEELRYLLEAWQGPGSPMDRAISQTLLINAALSALPALLDEVERLRSALTEVADTMEKDGRFPNTVPEIRAALKEQP